MIKELLSYRSGMSESTEPEMEEKSTFTERLVCCDWKNGMNLGYTIEKSRNFLLLLAVYFLLFTEAIEQISYCACFATFQNFHRMRTIHAAFEVRQKTFRALVGNF